MITEMITYGKTLFLDVFNSWWNSPIISNLLKVILGLWVIFHGVHIFFVGILVLIVFDVVTGIVASIKNGEKFDSKKLRKGLLERFVLYNIMLITVWIIESFIKTSINYDSFYGVMVISVMIASYECTSIIENLVRAYPQYKVLSKIGKILNMFDESVENRIKSHLEIEEKPNQ